MKINFYRFCLVAIPIVIAVVYFIWGGDPAAEGKFGIAFWIMVLGLFLVFTAWKHVKTFSQLKPFLIIGAVIVFFIVWGKYITIWEQLDLVVMSLVISYLGWNVVTTTSYKSLQKLFSNTQIIGPFFMAIIFGTIQMFIVFFLLSAIGLGESSLYNYAEPWMCPPGVESLAVGNGFREFDMPGFVAMLTFIPNCSGEAGAFTYSSIEIFVVSLLMAASFIFFMMILSTVANFVRKIPYISTSEKRFKVVAAVLSIIIMGGSNVYASRIFSPIALQLHSVFYQLNPDADYNGLLVELTEKGDIEGVKTLLKGGASTRGYSHSKHYTSVVAAATYGHTEIMTILLAERDDVTPAKDIRVALGNIIGRTNKPEKADQKYIDVARILLDAGANPLEEGANGWNLISFSQRDSRMVAVLMDAAVKKNPMLAALWEEGIAFNDNEFTKAIGRNDITSVKLFIELGMNADDGRYLVTSAIKGHAEMTRLLLEYCSDINYKQDNRYATPLIAASLSNSDSHIETARILLDAGADLNLKGRAGQTSSNGTAMFHARRNPEMLVMLKEYANKK